jgi:hypothetical protein
MSRRIALNAAAAAALLAPAAHAAPDADEARTIAREAYIYALPMVENYLSIYLYALDPDNSQYKGPLNQIHNEGDVLTPADTGVVTPNSDTPYSWLIMDLRAEPLVVTMPAIEDDRYYSLHLVDLYTHNVDFIGTRNDGNEGGDFLIAGPGWEGETPDGIMRVIRIPTDIVFGLIRTQLFTPSDIERVREIQAGYAVEPLSAFAGTEAPPPAPDIDWPEISRETAHPNFWSYATFLMQFAPPLDWEDDLRANFASVGVEAAPSWPSVELPADIEAAAIDAGDAAHAELGERVMALTSSAGLFGTPEEMRGRYVERALGAIGGLYGLTEEEAFYIIYMLDEDGAPLDAGRHDYVLRFPEGGLPPASAFWSLTMYGADRFLVDNPIDRYLINSPMIDDLVRDENGEIALYLQHESPGPELENNWLPAPDGEMRLALRIYLPKAEVLDATWVAPALEVR